MHCQFGDFSTIASAPVDLYDAFGRWSTLQSDAECPVVPLIQGPRALVDLYFMDVSNTRHRIRLEISSQTNDSYITTLDVVRCTKDEAQTQLRQHLKLPALYDHIPVDRLHPMYERMFRLSDTAPAWNLPLNIFVAPITTTIPVTAATLVLELEQQPPKKRQRVVSVPRPVPQTVVRPLVQAQQRKSNRSCAVLASERIDSFLDCNSIDDSEGDDFDLNHE